MDRASLLMTLLICASVAGATPFTFSSLNNTLHGEYLAPIDTEQPLGLIVFVHGDGATDITSNNFYPLYWQSLRRQGYIVASWSKPGVGNSSGNWLRQTMADRQQTLKDGIHYLQQYLDITPGNTGVLAFSQAGWVAPAIANSKQSIGFMIGIGFARNWIEQGRYYNQHDLSAYNADIEALHLGLAQGVQPENDRDWFVLNNFMADASEDYKNLAVPTLLLWGEADKNVNAMAEYRYWQQHNSPFVQTKLISQANHQLLDINKFPKRKLGFWSWVKYQWQGDNALAPTTLPTINQWLAQHAN